MDAMDYLFLFLVLLAMFVPLLSYADTIPREFEYNGEVYKYDEGFREYESTVKADIDGDGKKETIVSFQTRLGEVRVPVAFAFIFDDDKVAPVKVQLNDYPGEIKTYDFDKDGDEELILFSHGGMHYTHVDVYDYKNHNPVLMFENGSICPVEFSVENGVPMIKVGRAKWGEKDWSYASGDYLWEVYVWDGRAFVYRKELSTSPKKGECEDLWDMVEHYEKMQ